MSSSAYSTPPSRRPPLRHTSSSSSHTSMHNSPVRSFSLPMTIQTQTQTQTTNNSSGYTSPTRRGSSTSSSSPSSSRRSSWDEKRMDEQEREREIFMGALVSPGSGGGYDCEKSIDVPCIILTEPDNHHHRPQTPLRPKQILLLPPTSLPLPLHSSSSTTANNKSGWNMVVRAALLVAVVGLGGWHLWGVLGGIEGETQGL